MKPKEENDQNIRRKGHGGGRRFGGGKECSPSQIWLAVSNRFDKGGGIGALRRDWSERAKEREEGDRLAFRPSIWMRKKGEASERVPVG